MSNIGGLKQGRENARGFSGFRKEALPKEMEVCTYLEGTGRLIFVQLGIMVMVAFVRSVTAAKAVCLRASKHC